MKAQAAVAESKFERALVLAGDHAYKAAPYLHARLSAVMVGGDQSSNPRDVLAALLQEIDQQSRGERLIGQSSGRLN